jgi:hypothetical protein
MNNTWLLVEIDDHDVHSIVTHWHKEPTAQEITDMVCSLSAKPYHRMFTVVPANIPLWVCRER